MNTDDKAVLGHFFVGMILVVVIQVLFMFGGYLVEKRMNVPVTGIPSSIGLTVVLAADVLLSRKLSGYVLLGSFVLAFISPLILLLIVLFKAIPFTAPHMYWSIGYLAALTAAVCLYCVRRILKGGF